MLLAGVPQGSVLSPLLSNFYFNEMSARLSTCEIFQHADDTVLVSSHLDFHQAARLLQRDDERVVDWFSDNLFTINASKTLLACFRNPLKRINLDSSIVLHGSHCLDSECLSLEYVGGVKYLRVFCDSDLSWVTHLCHIRRKLGGVSFLLFNDRVFMPLAVTKSVAHALAYSVLRYGITLSGNRADV